MFDRSHSSFCPGSIPKYFSLGCLVEGLKAREVQSGESRNPLSPADRSEGRGRGPMAGLEMSQLLPTAAAALIYLVVFVRSHNKLTANHQIHIFYIVYFRADTREAGQ